MTIFFGNNSLASSKAFRTVATVLAKLSVNHIL